VAVSAVGAVVLAIATAVLVLQSQWFFNLVRERIIAEAEKATGGRVEIGQFQFDWRRLRAEVRNFTLHGTEPAGKPPLFHADALAIGLKIISLIDRDINVEYIDAAAPHVYLVLCGDGCTNIPRPRVRRTGAGAMDTILKLAVGHFDLRNGVFEIESQAKTPFDLRGRNLNAELLYDALAPRYRGQISIEPLDVRAPGFQPMPAALTASVSIEANRIGIESAKLTSGGASVQLSGEVRNFAAPTVTVRYEARGTMADAARMFRTKLLESGSLQASGNASWSSVAGYSVNGTFHGTNLSYRDSKVRLIGFKADGALAARDKQVQFSGVRFSGVSEFAKNRLPVEGRIEAAGLRDSELALRGLSATALGGNFRGGARLANFDRFEVTGDFSGFDTRRVVALYSAAQLPWDALVSGTTRMEGSLRRAREFTISTNAVVAPAPGGAPVHGQVAAAYDARTGIIDLGNSTLNLPSSRAEFSGAIGRQLQVRLETTNLNDLLPALGSGAAQMPVKLENGSAAFEGIVLGDPNALQLSGRLRVSNAAYQGELIHSLTADVKASPDSLRLENAAIARGPLNARFQLSVALRQWKADDTSQMFGSGAIRNARAADLAELLGQKEARVSGTISADARVTGTVGKPLVAADITAVRGSIEEEPFDRFSGHLDYSANAIRLSSGELDAGSKHVKLVATYTHTPGKFDTGRLQFDAFSNRMQADQIAAIQRGHPGANGVLQFSANGVIGIAPPSGGRQGYRIEDLHASASALDVQLAGQPLGDARITAESQKGVLRANIESDFANSTIRGNGQWTLTGDYPGSGSIQFSNLNFTRLRNWIAPSTQGPASAFAGFAQGEIHVEGPLLKPENLKAELRVPQFELSLVTDTGPGAVQFRLTNASPIVATMSNSVITVNSARFTGRVTDVSVAGKVDLRQKNPLDLRATGRIDPAVLHEFNRDFSATGVITLDVTARGELRSPQIAGRVQFQNAAFSMTDVSFGLSNANGAILFAGDRATIQSFTAEAGGGKVQLAGFATYTGGQATFRVHLRGESVRLRYPEGVSTVADSNLNFTGTTARSMLSGTVTVLRISFNPESDFSSIIASSAQPVRTPAARTGLLGGLNFDVQINSSPDIEVQSSLTQDVQLDANLRLRGTATNPALLGRINITQGQVLFFGSKYAINNGSISFFNPVRIAPVLDVSLDTRARGIDVTLTVSGPLDHLTLTPSSDPPLQFNEIVALLATGRTPSSDPTLITEQSPAAQSLQQLGASALLGQAIASPVAGRLQRFFGVSNLRINPALPIGETNLGARLTLEQQVTPNLTFTYITYVTSTNPEVVQVEWALSKKWSVLALREENGMTGISFLFKRRF
jgi:translocation and assembly module TamB